MPTGSALLALKPPAIDQTMPVTLATRTSDPIGPAGLVQISFKLLLGAVEPLELRQQEAFLELVGTARHGLTGMSVPVSGTSSPCAE